MHTPGNENQTHADEDAIIACIGHGCIKGKLGMFMQNVRITGIAATAALAIAGLVFSDAAKASDTDTVALSIDAKAPGTPPEELDGKDVSFPRILSDGASPTTALAAVKASPT